MNNVCNDALAVLFNVCLLFTITRSVPMHALAVLFKVYLLFTITRSVPMHALAVLFNVCLSFTITRSVPGIGQLLKNNKQHSILSNNHALSKLVHCTHIL